MSIVTRHGDGGETSLLYGGRVHKDDLHTEAYGALDEAISAIGLARALSAEPLRAQRLLDLQRDLFTVGAELATATPDRDKLEKHFATVTPTGEPLPIPLALVMMSGTTPYCSMPNHLPPVRPQPVCTSSLMKMPP